MFDRFYFYRQTLDFGIELGIQMPIHCKCDVEGIFCPLAKITTPDVGLSHYLQEENYETAKQDAVGYCGDRLGVDGASGLTSH